MYNFYVNKIKFKNGKEINMNKINIIIGPNNCGKSTTLNELYKCCTGYRSSSRNNILVDQIACEYPKSIDEFKRRYNLDSLIYKTSQFQTYLKCMNFNEQNNNRVQVNSWESSIDAVISNNNNNENFLSNFGSLFTTILRTESRLTLIKKSQVCGLEDYNTNFLSELDFNDKIMVDLGKSTKKLFDKDVILERDSLSSRVLFRVTNDNFDYYRNSKKFDSECIERLRLEKELDLEGDGLKSFVTMYCSLFSKNSDIIIIDEPEAFLHPPLARKLGEIIANLNLESKQIFLTTHSADFLKGILTNPIKVNIMRISKEDNNFDISLFENKDLMKVINDPLLSASRVIEGLFCEKVVLTESDSDEMFYESLATKIKSYNGLYFTHGQNKNTLFKIADIYKRLNVKFAIIYDFDLLREKDDLNKILKIIDLNSIEKTKIQKFRKELELYINSKIQLEVDLLVSKGKIENDNNIIKEYKKNLKDKYYWSRGKRCLSRELQHQSTIIFNLLKSNGVYIIENGCLETWFDFDGIPYTTNKKKWFKDALFKIRDDVKNNTKPYKFIKQIMGLS